jgi:hypothetical protein
MRRFLLTVATAATALTATACTDVTGTRRDLEGTYILEEVNGASLPEYVSELDAEFVSGEVTLFSDGTYEDEIRLRYPGDPIIRRFPSSGRYTVRGDRIEFRPDQSDIADFEREWDRDTLIERDPDIGLTLVFRR